MLNTNQKRTFEKRFDDFSFLALSLICDYMAQTPKQAVKNFGTVCRRWLDVVTTTCRPMWKRLIIQTFPELKNRTLDSYAEFFKLADRLVIHSVRGDGRRLPPPKNRAGEAFPLLEIEECGGKASSTNKHVGDDNEIGAVVDFSFICPVLIQNMTRLNETTPSGLPKFGCDICKKEVWVCGEKDLHKLAEYAKNGICVTLSSRTLQMFGKQAWDRGSRFGSTFKDPREQTVNIVFVVSTPAQETMISEMFRRVRFSKESGLAGTNYEKPLLVTKDTLHFINYDTEPGRWFFRVVRVDPVVLPAAATNTTTTNPGAREYLKPKDRFGKAEPCEEQEDPRDKPTFDKLLALAPAQGGWSFVICLPGATFHGDAKVGSPMLALQRTGRVLDLAAFVRSKPQLQKQTYRSDPVQIPVPLALEQLLPSTEEEEISALDSRGIYPEDRLDAIWAILEDHLVTGYTYPTDFQGGVLHMTKPVSFEGPTPRLHRNPNQLKVAVPATSWRLEDPKQTRFFV